VTGTEELTRQAGAEFIDPYRDDAKDFADGVNAEQVETGRSLSWEEVMEQAERWRERTHALWTALGDVSDEAATFFAEETSVHYDEHTEQIRRFLAGS
jgi:cell wall assembly regulator SMI1